MKHEEAQWYQWRKVHLRIDAQTLEIRAIEVNSTSVGDAPMRPLPQRLFPRERMPCYGRNVRRVQKHGMKA